MKKTKKEKQRVNRQLEQSERNILSTLSLGKASAKTIAKNLNSSVEEIQEILDSLEQKNFVERGGILGEYELTADGYRQIGHPQLKIETDIGSNTISPDGETGLWVSAKNSGNVPVHNTRLRLVAPKFVKISRYGSRYENGGDTAVTEFELNPLYPEEMQSVHFKLRGSLVTGVESSKYNIEVQAVNGEEKFDRKQISLLVQR